MAAKTGTYTLIASTTIGTATGTVTFSSIPATYTDLVLVIQYQSAANCVANITFNNDTGSNYSTTYLSGNGTTAASARGSNETSIGTVYTGASFNGKLGQVTIQVQDYSNATTYKTAINRTSSAGGEATATVGLWRSTAAINRVDVTGTSGATFASGSTFKLYGIEAGNN
jgi:hypothetical protein